MKKKILIVDDSALMRRVFCDIINSDERFEVVNIATDGAEGFKYLCQKEYDAVVLDVYMPKMTGLQLLEEMQKSKVSARVLMASTTTGEGAQETLDALTLGAVDFIKKPENVANARQDGFSKEFLDMLYVVSCAPMPRFTGVTLSDSRNKNRTFTKRYDVNFHTTAEKLATERSTATSRLNNRPLTGTTTSTATTRPVPPSFTSLRSGDASNITLRKVNHTGRNRIVAIASSTGGPKALQDVIPYLPGDLPVPVVLVQHMPKGFTKTLADRLNEISAIKVSEAVAGETLQNGHVYIAPGGSHLKIVRKGSTHQFIMTDEPSREGVKPCANYMYESLEDCGYDEIVCVVMTGMGADGTVGIKSLTGKKPTYIIAQDQDTSTVYGMPKSIALTGLVSEVVPLNQIAEQITKNAGVH